MKNIIRCLPIVVSLSVALGVSPAVQALDKVWVCGTGFWDTSACWSPAGQPMEINPLDPLIPDSAFLTQSGTSNIVITYRNNTNPPMSWVKYGLMEQEEGLFAWSSRRWILHCRPV